MWANAQHDGRPAEYRWRPLFNAAKFGWRPLLQRCAVMLPKQESSRLGRKVNVAPGKIPLRGKNPQKCTYSVPAQETAKHRAAWLASVERRRCSNETKTRNLLQSAGAPQSNVTISAPSRPNFTILWGHADELLPFNNFFPIVDTCLSCEDIARQSCAMVPRWQIFGSCISSKSRAAHFRPVF